MLLSPNIPFTRNWLLHLVIAGFAVLWGVLAVSPSSRMDWLLENVPLAALIIVLAATYRVFRFSNLSYILIAVFLTLHAVGAHYSYQNTPIDTWLKQAFHLQRSVFDRIVHFTFGLLMAYPIRELLVRAGRLTGFWAYWIPVTVGLSCNALYEIIEMRVAQLVAPDLAEMFLGIQGDPWDTQKDMELGFLGAVIAMGLVAVIRGLRKKKAF
jgi:putative membrane protein